MKIKKWYIFLGIILTSYASIDLMNAPQANSVAGLILLLIQEFVFGFLNLLGLVIKFALSWQGVLLLLVILLYKSWNKYVDKKFNK